MSRSFFIHLCNILFIQSLTKLIFKSPFLRPFYHGGEDTEAGVRQADRVCGGHDQNLRQLPLLQPQRLALLPVCRGSGDLLCPETQRLQSQQVRRRWWWWSWWWWWRALVRKETQNVSRWLWEMEEVSTPQRASTWQNKVRSFAVPAVALTCDLFGLSPMRAIKCNFSCASGVHWLLLLFDFLLHHLVFPRNIT